MVSFTQRPQRRTAKIAKVLVQLRTHWISSCGLVVKAKVLLDCCIWGGVKQELTIFGYDVKWVGDFQEDRVIHQYSAIVEQSEIKLIFHEK